MADARAGIGVYAGIVANSAPSALEREVVEQFDLMRERLLRYLLGFGLTAQDSEEIVRGWLFRVAHNLGLRKRQRMRATEEVGDSVIDPAPNPEDQCATSQTERRLLAVLRALPEQDRRCLSLRAEGLRYREIAEVLDMSLGAVSIALTRSLARIARSAER
ncbi:MAG: sigma-70 family RNA polymerase sigma factor [Bryobacteraceae bacterium]